MTVNRDEKNAFLLAGWKLSYITDLSNRMFLIGPPGQDERILKNLDR